VATRIRTTHVGSLPRPAQLRELLLQRDRGDAVDETAFQALVQDAVRDVVARQVAVGLDIVSDGEMSKIAYSLYPKERLNGFHGTAPPRPRNQEAADFPNWAQSRIAVMQNRPACDGPISRKPDDALEIDLRNFRAAVEAARPSGAFMTAASPGVIAMFMPNHYYPTHAAYVNAIAEAMQPEYEAIVAAGFDLQLDCPDLAAARHNSYISDTNEEWMRRCDASIDALNGAVAAIPPERMRLHLCWGNYEGPHHYDLPLDAVLPFALKGRPRTISFEGANPRHGHEWEVFDAVTLPDDLIIMPGVIDSTSNFIEHPRLIAQRIQNYARIVGPERVIAGVDCGFATTVEYHPVDADIAWAKLGALAEGAALVSA
jgi:5-methyltetrahydropteroyltriglutamate--homocysteine methyltransferase